MTTTRIISSVAAVIILIVALVGNYYLNVYEAVIHSFFVGNNDDGNGNVDSETQENVLGLADDVVREIAEDSMVLLKNQNNTLPLDKARNASVNLFGFNATKLGYLLTGGGSGGTRPVQEKIIYLEDAFAQAGISVNTDLLRAYYNWDNLDLDSGATTAAQCTLTNPGEDFYTDELMNQAKAFSNTAIVVIGRWGRENGTKKDDNGTTHYDIPFVQIKSQAEDDYSRTYLEISTEEELMLEKVKANFDNVIVLLNLCNTMELGFLDDEGIDAALYIGTTGQSGTTAIPKILYGDVTPSGKTADVYAYEHQADPTWAFTKPDYSNKDNHYTTYQEGIYYGYRWYETAFADKLQMTTPNGYDLDFSTEEGYRKIVQYPFGFGLSYTEFSWEIIEGPADDSIIEDMSFDGGKEYTIKVRVTNTGTRPGKDVVQLYFTPPYYEGEIEKSALTLLDFAKTETLLPANMTEDGIPQSQVLTLKFTDYDIACYDCYDANKNDLTGYELDAGEYEFKLMRDSHTLADVIPSAAAADGVITMKVLEDIWFPFDYESGEFVENRFTGENSYGSPVDGGVEYMTRANFSATFPEGHPEGNYNVNDAENVYTGLTNVQYGQNNGLYLVTLPDGSKPTLDQLTGKEPAELKYNEELLKQLWDYDNNEVWDKFLSQITKEETLDLIKLGGMQNNAVASLGVMRTVESDGPSGISNSVINADVAMNRTGWQSQSLLGCSWNPKMAYNMGRAVGLEGRTVVNINGWYAPGVNLHRSPYTSRNFEYYSEDPVLSGKLGAEVIRGAKNNGLTCYLKHFAVSEGGKNPAQVYTWLTEQTMREIYLKPFEMCVKDGGANAVMSAFNRVGDVGSYHNRALLEGVLRGEWGFRGVVITDWWSDYMTTADCILAGNDKLLNTTKIDGTVNKENDQAVDLSDPSSPVSNMARKAVKNIIFSTIDSYMTAKDYAENGDVDDPYAVNIDKITVTQAAHSTTFVALWIGVDVLLALLFLLCAFKAVKPE